MDETSGAAAVARRWEPRLPSESPGIPAAAEMYNSPPYAAVAPARNPTVRTSKMNHSLKNSGSDQENEDGTKGREVGSGSVGGLVADCRPNPSWCRRNLQVSLVAVMWGDEFGHPAPACRTAAARCPSGCTEVAGGGPGFPACNLLAKVYHEVHRSAGCARPPRRRAQG